MVPSQRIVGREESEKRRSHRLLGEGERGKEGGKTNRSVSRSRREKRSVRQNRIAGRGEWKGFKKKGGPAESVWGRRRGEMAHLWHILPYKRNVSIPLSLDKTCPQGKRCSVEKKKKKEGEGRERQRGIFFKSRKGDA